MSYIRLKIKNGRFKNPLAQYKRKNLEKYFGSLSKRRPCSTQYDDDRCLLRKSQQNCLFDVADVKVNDFIRFEFTDDISKRSNKKVYIDYVEYVRVHSITEKEICFDTYINRISWESHQDRQYY